MSGELGVNALQSAEVEGKVGPLHAVRTTATATALMPLAGFDRMEASSTEEIPLVATAPSQK
jgi:hypothetical protein